MSESFTAFREQYLSRHENPVNSALHTLADALEVAGLAAGVVYKAHFERQLVEGMNASLARIKTAAERG